MIVQVDNHDGCCVVVFLEGVGALEEWLLFSGGLVELLSQARGRVCSDDSVVCFRLILSEVDLYHDSYTRHFIRDEVLPSTYNQVRGLGVLTYSTDIGTGFNIYLV